ncbi:MAG: glycerophosphodiester phosphodiesterase family protein [Chloroflexi bacterium]|nr:glycerophosphodiester phosphodiesterase family protein [Chloroflexota bacterium]
MNNVNIPAHRPLLVAHRGGAGHRPENTLAAIEHALELGVEVIEVDVRCSANQNLVLLHDDALDRTTNGSGDASQQSAEQLARLDAGSHFGPRFADQGVPTLEAAFELVGDRAGWDFDLKDRNAVVPLLAMIDRLGLRERCWLTGMRIADVPLLVPHRVRTLPILFPHSGEASDLLAPSALASTAATLADAGACGLNVDHRLVRGPAVAEALAKKGIALWTFTVNRADLYREMVAAGARAICSDYPGDMPSDADGGKLH